AIMYAYSFSLFSPFSSAASSHVTTSQLLTQIGILAAGESGTQLPNRVVGAALPPIDLGQALVPRRARERSQVHRLGEFALRVIQLASTQESSAAGQVKLAMLRAPRKGGRQRRLSWSTRVDGLRRNRRGSFWKRVQRSQVQAHFDPFEVSQRFRLQRGQGGGWLTQARKCLAFAGGLSGLATTLQR